MRIVDVCAFYSPWGGGVKTYIDRKLKAGPAAGHEIVVLAPGPRDETVAFGPHARLELIAAPSFPLDRRYRYFGDEAVVHDALDRLRPDMVEASSPWRSAATVARWRGSAPRALIMHADPLSAYAYRWFGPIASRDAIDRGFDWFWRHLRRLDAGFDAVVTANGDLARRLRDGGLRNIVLNPMGVEGDSFSPARRDAAVRRELLARCGLPPEAILLLGIGRHATEKRWPMVIEAVTAVAYRRPVGLVLLGEGRDRARLAAAIGGNPHIAMVPPIRDRARFATALASADAMVHGCEAETFCMAAAEARASGVPMIVPDRGGALDQCVPGGGIAYASADRLSLVDAIGALLDSGLDAARARAVAAAADVRLMDDHFADLFALYGHLVMERRDAA